MRIDEATCPSCGSHNTLHVDSRYVLDRNQLSGETVVATIKPLLSCVDCDMYLFGEFSDDGFRVTFTGPLKSH